jgi:hypothetical protein
VQIEEPWLSLVHASRAALLRALQDGGVQENHVIGIYLRGSIPQGTAVPYISDVDLSAYYLAEEPPDGPRPHGPCLASAVDSHIIRAKARLQAQHPFCTKIGVISNQSQTGRVCHCAYGHTVSLNFK